MRFHSYLSSKTNNVPTGILNLTTDVQNCRVNLNCRLKFKKYVVTRDRLTVMEHLCLFA